MVSLICGLTFVAIGAASLVYYISEALDGSASKRWPSVRGAIVNVESNTMGDTDGGLLYQLKVIYRFNYGAGDMIGRRARYGDLFAVPLWAIRGRRWPPYTIGEEVNVFYRPDVPGDSVLQPGINKTIVVGICVGAVMMALGALVIIGGDETWQPTTYLRSSAAITASIARRSTPRLGWIED